LISQVLEIERDSTSDGQLLITLFGVTPYGNSVALRVSKFRPFLYLELPPNWDDMTISHAINNIKRELQIKTERAAYFASKNASEAASTSVAETESTFRARHVPANVQPNANAAMKIESFQIEKRKQLMGFSQSPLRLLKLIVNSPETVRAVQDIAIAGVDCSAAQKPNTFASTKSSTSFSANKPTSSTSSLVSLKVHESSVDVILRFCVDIDLLGCSWIRIPANHFRVRPLPFLSNADSKHGFNSSLKGAPKPFSSCQLEVETSVESIQSIVSEHQWSRVARLVALSFDIECIGSDGAFPDATKIDNQLIQIGCSVMICGNADAREDDEKNKIAACSCCAPCYRCNHRKSSSECSFSKCESGAEKVDNRIVFKALFTSRPCSSIPGVAVHVVESESALLQAFAKFIIDVDPDVVTGYNIVNFDLPYVLNRVKLLKLPAEAATLGRFPNCKSVPQAISFVIFCLCKISI
jgi:DNA polymerase elongation subunit (family B)